MIKKLKIYYLRNVHVIDGSPSLTDITYENNAKDEIYYSESN